MPNCAVTHLCYFLATRGYRLADPTNYTESLPEPSAHAPTILAAVGATGEAHLIIIDAEGKRCGWVWLILPPAVGADEAVADYGDNALMEEWASAFEADCLRWEPPARCPLTGIEYGTAS
jgi:hypothetical protein